MTRCSSNVKLLVKCYPIIQGRILGFRLVADISDENTNPIPTPAPANPIVANPAPMYFAACNIFGVIMVKLLIQCNHVNISFKSSMNRTYTSYFEDSDSTIKLCSS